MPHTSERDQSQDSVTIPSSIIIIGAGVFGLSSALAFASRHPKTKVTVVDRLTPPVKDGTSVDTTRCIRSDYADPVYQRLAEIAQEKIMQDPELQPWTFQQGMTYVCNGRPSRFTDIWKAQLEKARSRNGFRESPSRGDVFRQIHGEGIELPSSEQTEWNVSYSNMLAAFIDAEESVRVYYQRCLRHPSITFKCGIAVRNIAITQGRASGVVLENGDRLDADLMLVAAGAWSNKLVSLGQRVHPIGHEVVWFKVTQEEEARWKNMSITTNLSTGLNIFPPYRGEVKVLRRSPGYTNTISIPDPEIPSTKIRISYPRTMVDEPSDVIPLDAELAIRKNLREIMPSLADRPFDRTRICWINTTPTADFLIAPHPRIAGIHMATGGSAHAWKFLPCIGDWVVDSVAGKLEPGLAEKWSFDRLSDGKDSNAPRMDGASQELNDVVRHHL